MPCSETPEGLTGANCSSNQVVFEELLIGSLALHAGEFLLDPFLPRCLLDALSQGSSLAADRISEVASTAGVKEVADGNVPELQRCLTESLESDGPGADGALFIEFFVVLDRGEKAPGIFGWSGE